MGHRGALIPRRLDPDGPSATEEPERYGHAARAADEGREQRRSPAGAKGARLVGPCRRERGREGCW